MVAEAICGYVKWNSEAKRFEASEAETPKHKPIKTIFDRS
jgi:hypothetical protein